MSTVVIRSPSPSEISVSRTPTRETQDSLPAVIRDLLVPFQLLRDAIDFSSGVPLEPSISAVVTAYPRLLAILEGEVAEYIRAYADKCDHLEDQVLSLRLHLRRLMQVRRR
jgi:hypothetical protein